MLWFNVGYYRGRRGGSSSCCGLMLGVTEAGGEVAAHVVV